MPKSHSREMEQTGSSLVTVSCEGHNKTLADGLWRLLQMRHETNFDLRLNEVSVPAHKIVLEVFLGPDKLQHNVKSGIKQEMPDSEDENSFHGTDSGDSLNSLLEFMYKGEVAVPAEQLEGLLEVARELDFQMLVDAIVQTTASSRNAHTRRTGLTPSVEDPCRAGSIFEPILELVEPEEGSSNKNEWDEGWSRSGSGCSEVGSSRIEEEKEAELVDVCDLGAASGLTVIELSKPSTPKYSCSHCKYTTSHQGHLKRHLKLVHEEVRMLKCPQCPSSFRKRENLKNHVSVLHGVGPSRFVCETCGKRCTSRYQLSRHGRTHTHERPFVCQHCDLSFGQNANLKQHLDAVHGLGPSRFRCEICNKRCGSRSELVRHSLTHTGAKPYFCHTCDRTFTRRDKLNRHLQAFHKEHEPLSDDIRLMIDPGDQNVEGEDASSDLGRQITDEG